MILSVDSLHPLVLNVGLAVHDGDWNWQNVSSPFMRIYYVVEGTAQVVLPAGTVTLRPEHLYAIPAYTRHSYQCDGPFTHYYLHIYDDSHAGALSSLTDEWELPTEVDALPSDRMLMRRLCDANPAMQLRQSDPLTYDNSSTLAENVMLNKQRTLAQKMESRGIVFQLLARFLHNAHPRTATHDERILAAIRYIKNHTEESIHISRLADIACVSKDHFIRLFKHETGTTPLRYINERKIEHAQLLLATSDMPVKAVALRLALDNYSYFNRLFKGIAGMTPLQYRQIHRG